MVFYLLNVECIFFKWSLQDYHWKTANPELRQAHHQNDFGDESRSTLFRRSDDTEDLEEGEVESEDGVAVEMLESTSQKTEISTDEVRSPAHIFPIEAILT